VAFLMVRTRKRAGVVAGLAALIAGSFTAPPAAADAGWFESGDTLLRMDLQLLNDAEVIRLPLNQWPLPRAAVQYALANAKEHFVVNNAVKLALERVRTRAEDRSGWNLLTGVSAGNPGLLRDFDTLAREEGELGASANYDGERIAVGIDVTGVANPDDGDEVRADGSHATVQLGNWLLSANTLDRYWGPSHESSLILSNNARPMPTVMVERAEARPFESKWLSWLGPWRFSFGISQMEHEREDIDAPLFMAWRVEIMPYKDIEFGFSRTAQFCGEQLACSWDVFWNMIAGNDNPGFDTTPEEEPGNQMAGFDIRWNSPIGNWPYAVYAQAIGEDEANYAPVKYLEQFGLEVWKPQADGGLVQVFAEYASTTCSANTSRGPYYNCAYNQGRFNVEGYRYHGRVIGYTTDSDSETYSLGAILNTADGDLWTATARTSQLNHDGIDTRNTVSAGPAKYAALELGWKGRLFGERVSVDLGVEALEPDGVERDVEPFGFIGWRHDFAP
jgi:hypothetical protein